MHWTYLIYVLWTPAYINRIELMSMTELMSIETAGLYQHIHDPTHKDGHTLDLENPWVLVGASESGNSMIAYLLRQLKKVIFCDFCLTFDP